MKKIGIINIMIIAFNFSYSQTSVISDVKEIIKYGTYAPSSHNAQMWSVKIIDNNKIKIYPDNKRVLSYVDPKNRETWISIGAFVENCVLSAQDLGYKTMVEVNENEVIVNLKKDNNIKISKNNINNILKRLTIRTPYLDDKIDKNIIDNITNISENIFYYPKETSQGNVIIDNSIKAYTLQMQDTSKLKELSEWMTFSYKEERERKDGLTPEMLGITGIKHFLFNTFMSKKSVTGKTFIKGSIKTAKKQLNSCLGFIIITSNSFSNKDLLQSGRDLENIWLKFTENEIAVQPISQALEEKEYYEKLKKELKINGEIEMVLRIGKVKKYTTPIRRRLKLNEILSRRKRP